MADGMRAQEIRRLSIAFYSCVLAGEVGFSLVLWLMDAAGTGGSYVKAFRLHAAVFLIFSVYNLWKSYSSRRSFRAGQSPWFQVVFAILWLPSLIVLQFIHSGALSFSERVWHLATLATMAWSTCLTLFLGRRSRMVFFTMFLLVQSLLFFGVNTIADAIMVPIATILGIVASLNLDSMRRAFRQARRESLSIWSEILQLQSLRTSLESTLHEIVSTLDRLNSMAIVATLRGLSGEGKDARLRQLLEMGTEGVRRIDELRGQVVEGRLHLTPDPVGAPGLNLKRSAFKAEDFPQEFEPHQVTRYLRTRFLRFISVSLVCSVVFLTMDGLAWMERGTVCESIFFWSHLTNSALAVWCLLADRRGVSGRWMSILVLLLSFGWFVGDSTTRVFVSLHCQAGQEASVYLSGLLLVFAAPLVSLRGRRSVVLFLLGVLGVVISAVTRHPSPLFVVLIALGFLFSCFFTIVVRERQRVALGALWSLGLRCEERARAKDRAREAESQCLLAAQVGDRANSPFLVLQYALEKLMEGKSNADTLRAQEIIVDIRGISHWLSELRERLSEVPGGQQQPLESTRILMRNSQGGGKA